MGMLPRTVYLNPALAYMTDPWICPDIVGGMQIQLVHIVICNVTAHSLKLEWKPPALKKQ